MAIVLSDFSHFKDNEMVNFKEEIVAGKKFTIVIYMIATNDYWYQPLAKETRGHVFDETGKLVSAAFEKFFNIGEKEFTQFHSLDFTNAKKFAKLDGSMIDTMVMDGHVWLKTKKSFYSDVAVCAMKCINDNEKDLVLDLYKRGYSVIFEFYHPEWKIVVDYGNEPKFTVLAARSLTDLSYFDDNKLEQLCKEYEVKYVTQYSDKTIDDIMQEVSVNKDAEGYVILLQNGRRVKQKFDWYHNNHKINTELRIRDVAEMVVNETIDDIKAKVAANGLDISKIEEIEDRVAIELLSINLTVNCHAEACQLLNVDIRELVVRYKKHPLQGLIFRRFKGQVPNIIKYWRQNYLKTYPLNCVYNTKFSQESLL